MPSPHPSLFLKVSNKINKHNLISKWMDGWMGDFSTFSFSSWWGFDCMPMVSIFQNQEKQGAKAICQQVTTRISPLGSFPLQFTFVTG
jgi:hypothetical protein